MIDGATNQIKMGKFSNILEKGKNRAIVRELLGGENFARLERLQNATGKLATSAEKFFNASKSGAVAVDAAVITKGLYDIGSILTGNPWPLMSTLGGLASARGLAKMMTDPVFLKSVEDGILAAGKGDVKLAGRHFNYAMRPMVQDEKIFNNQWTSGEPGVPGIRPERVQQLPYTAARIAIV